LFCSCWGKTRFFLQINFEVSVAADNRNASHRWKHNFWNNFPLTKSSQIAIEFLSKRQNAGVFIYLTQTILDSHRNKQAGEAIHTSPKVNFKLKLVRRDKEGHLTLIKGEINQEEIKSINIYAPNINAPNFKKIH
jgi:hypothetical protein